MFSKRTAGLAVVLMVLIFSSVACSFDLERASDGAWLITGHVSEEETQRVITQALDDPNLRNVQVDFKDGYIAVTGEHQSADGTHYDNVGLRLDLGVADGHLTAVLGEVEIAGFEFPPALVDTWNREIAEGLASSANEDPANTLVSVTVTETDLTMVLRHQELDS